MSPIMPIGLGMNPLQPLTTPTELPLSPQSTSGSAPGAAFQNFGDMLGQAIDSINSTQATADTASTQLMTGQSTDLHSVMIDMEKAKVTFDLAVQVRNQTLNAYNELMRTQV